MSERVNKILYLVLSLLIAVVFWLYVDGVQGNTRTLTFNGIPIELIGAEDTLPGRNLIVTGGADSTVDLRVSLPRTWNLNKEDILVQADLSGISSEGPYTRYLSFYFPENVDRTRIDIEYQSRSAVTVQVSQMYSKTVPVSVNVANNEVAEGYIYMADLLVAEPSSLTLRGREEDVADIASARVTVDLSGANATLQQDFAYELLDSEGNTVSADGIRVSEKRIEVTAPVYIIKELPLVVRFKQSPGSMESNIRWDLADPSITVAGEYASLENVSEITLAEVDLSQLLSGSQELDMDIPIPDRCSNLSGFSTTKLSVRFRNMETKTVSVTNITAIGLAEGQQFSKVTSFVDVMLRGPAGEMDNVTEEDVRIVVDLTDYGNGTMSVPAIIYVDGHNNEVGAIGSYSVTCKISS